MFIRHSYKQTVNNVTLDVEKDIIIRIGGSISQLWNTVGRWKFRTYLLLTLISKSFMLSRLSNFVVCRTSLRLSNFVVCRTSLHIWNSIVYI